MQARIADSKHFVLILKNGAGSLARLPGPFIPQVWHVDGQGGIGKGLVFKRLWREQRAESEREVKKKK